MLASFHHGSLHSMHQTDRFAAWDPSMDDPAPDRPRAYGREIRKSSAGGVLKAKAGVLGTTLAGPGSGNAEGGRQGESESVDRKKDKRERANMEDESNSTPESMAAANELVRLKNIAESRMILAELGLHKSWQVHSNNNQDMGRDEMKWEETENDASAFVGHQLEKKPTNKLNNKRKRRLRQSPRLLLENNMVNYHSKKQNLFGHIPGIPVGTLWATRLECCTAGVHRYPVAGIHGNPLYGCYSIALSGGYEDDLDLGDCFTYTGEGGRVTGSNNGNPKDMRMKPQIKDMIMTRGNLSLTRNIKTRKPVRVIRGFQLQSPYAPLLGYRYDGLYYVEKYWEFINHSGFRTIKFALRRCENQDPPPWISKISATSDSGYNSPESTTDCIPSLELPLADEELDMIDMDCQAADVDVDCDLEALNLHPTVKTEVETQRKPSPVSKSLQRKELLFGSRSHQTKKRLTASEPVQRRKPFSEPLQTRKPLSASKPVQTTEKPLAPSETLQRRKALLASKPVQTEMKPRSDSKPVITRQPRTASKPVKITRRCSASVQPGKRHKRTLCVGHSYSLRRSSHPNVS